MAAYITLTVDIDADAIMTAAEHADVAVDAGIMDGAYLNEWFRSELERYVTARA